MSALSAPGVNETRHGRVLELEMSNPAQRNALTPDTSRLVTRALRGTAKPVIAAVEGHAAGAGSSIALGCDLIVAAESAVFTLAYVKIGVNPDGGGTWFLAHALPPQLAKELALSATPVPASRLTAHGVVNRVAAAGRARAETLAWAAELAAGATQAIGRTKRLLWEAVGQDLARRLDRERESFADGMYGLEGAEGFSAFIEKRKPRFHG